MLRLSNSWAVIVLVVAGLLTCGAVASWEDYRTDAVRDGIGYRSNLIDPHNPYASSERRNFGALLARLGLIEDWTDIGGAPKPMNSVPANQADAEASVDPAYQVNLREVLEPYTIDELFPGMPTEQCRNSGYKAARLYIRALAAAKEPHPARAKLVAARLRLSPGPWECLRPDSKDAYVASLRSVDGEVWRPWRDYVEGAAHFYAGDFDQAVEAFARVPRTDTWLGATAAFMPVRIAFDRLRQYEANLYWAPDREDFGSDVAGRFAEYDTHWGRLADAIEEFIGSGLDQGYRDPVLDFRVYAALTSRDPTRSSALWVSELERHFGQSREAGGPRDLYGQFKNYLVWRGVRVVEWNNPLWQVNRMLVALVQDRQLRMMSDFDRQNFAPAVTLHEAANSLSASLASENEVFDDYTGFLEYAEVLLAFAREDWERVVTMVSDAAAATPFLPDLLLLKARAQAALSDHWEAATTWRHIFHRWPALNAAGEAGRQAVKAGRFADFARLDWVIDIGHLENGEADAHQVLEDSIRWLRPWTALYLDADEDEMVLPAAFLRRERPIHSVLREGLGKYTEPGRLAEVAHDPAAPPLLRWYALEPLLVASLVSGQYETYIAHAESLAAVARGLDRRALRSWQRPESTEKFLNILPSVRTLAENREDAESLMTLAYFIYSRHLFPLCDAKKTLWSEELGGCQTAGAGWVWGDSPIVLFERALKSFEQRPTRTDAEARLLRMMIYCFRTTPNRDSCLRGSSVGSDKETRAGWFRRLHKHFPEAANETPYWY